MKTVARLLDTVKPTRYQLTLKPDLKNFTFTGHEAMELELAAPSRQLVLHAVDLDIGSASVDGQSASVSYQKEDQTATFNFARELSGQVKLELEYSGPLRDDLHGFYRSSYKDEQGHEHWMATTQFESTYAREAFVGVDEPAAKAVFDVELIIPNDLEAISNTNIVSEETSDGSKIVTFATTPKMSTYLLAFLIGNFERKTMRTKNGVEVGVYTTTGKLHQADFALEVAAKTLDFYTDYFDIPYPLPKLDMIAVPDFSAGAMENWGAVTYRETAILVDPQQTALANKQWVAMVVAHELAHQWFGNLVTMAWWTDLWLNEGFASWVEYLAVDHLYPEWQMWTQFVSSDYAEARQLDSLANTHPIEVEVGHPDEIGEIFDAISYQKGASVIRMLYHYIGEKAFRAGLHNYLKAFSYGNAVTSDLWKHLGVASGQPVETVMAAWTKQAGYPLVTLRKHADDTAIDQKRFFSDPKQPADATTWPIPLAIMTEHGASQPILIDQAHGHLHSGYTGWEKPNAGQTGVYLINYSRQQLEQLRPVLPQLSVIDRLGVISDAAMLVPAGLLSSDESLKLAASLRHETDYAVWMSILDTVGPYGVLIENNQREQFDRFLVSLVEPTVTRLGWEKQPGESYFDALLRPAVLRIAGLAGHQATVAEARKRFADYLNGQDLDADLRRTVYTIVSRHGGEQEYAQLEKLADAATLQEEQRRLLGALGMFKQPELLQRTLQRAVSDKVRTQDTVIVIMGVLANRYGRDLAWQFIQDNWKLMIERYGAGGHILKYIPDAVGGAFARHEAADQIEQFFATHDKPGIERTIQQALEQIRLNADWWERDKDGIKTFLAQHVSS